MKVAALLGRNVLDLATATTVARVEDVLVDPDRRRVTGLRLAKSSATGDWVAWEQITAIGPDAVTIASAENATSFPGADVGRSVGHGALGGRVLTAEGRDAGRLDDVEFDDDGALVALLVGGAVLDAQVLLGIGSYATVVVDPET